MWLQDTSKAAEPRAKLSRAGLRWALEGILCQHLTVAHLAEGLGVSWKTANNAVLAEGRRVLIDDPGWFDGVAVIIDVTPVRDGTNPARLLDMLLGRSKAAFQDWLAEREDAWRQGVKVVAMDGFSGFKTATTEELPEAVAVRDAFHVVRLAGDFLEECRRRIQQHTCGHRSHKGDPLYSARSRGRATDPAHRGGPAHWEAVRPADQAVRSPGARRGRGDLEDLPADDRRLPRTRPGAMRASR